VRPGGRSPAGFTVFSGRIGLLHLLPFSYRECYQQSQSPPDLDQVLFAGLYPPIHDRRLAPSLWYANYVQTYIERDVRQLVAVGDLSAFGRFVRLCAGRTDQLLNLSSLASDCGITHNTARAWISILEASYLVFRVLPHHRNFTKRLIKTPQLYFYDPGLAAWLLGLRDPGQLAVHPLRGALFETFVLGAVRELLEECRVEGSVVRQTSYLHYGPDDETYTFLVEIGYQAPSLGHDPEVAPGRTVLADLQWLRLRDLPELDRAFLWAAGLLGVEGFLPEARQWSRRISYPGEMP